MLLINVLPAAILAAADAPDPGWTAIEVIVVTANRDEGYVATGASALRTPVPINQVPQAVQVLTRTLLEEQDLNTLSDAVQNISSVVPAAPSEAVLVNPIVRGFESEILIDGLMAYGDTAVIDPSSMSGVERIEVAKGPTSVLFGGGAGAPVGGLINVVTKTPNSTPSYAVQYRGGSFETVQPSIDINQPLGDAVAVRLTGEYLSSDDAIDEVNIDRTTFNPSLRVDLGADTDVLFRYGYNKIEQLEYAGLPSEVVSAPGVHRFRFSGATDAPRTEITNKMGTGVLTHRFSDALKTVLQVRNYKNDFSEYASFPFVAFFPPTGTAYPIIKGELPASVDQWTVDASVVGEFATGSITHVVIGGVQYDSTDYNGKLGFDFVPIGILDYAVRGSDVPYGPKLPPQSFAQYQNTYGTNAVYVQDQATVAERFHLLGGVRYSELSIDERFGTGNNSYNEVNPRVGAVVDLVPGVSAFVDYATGSRLTLFFNGGTRDPKPETSDAVGGGIKLGLTDIGLSGTIAIYRQNRSNVPNPDPSNPFVSVQTGKERAEGFETDLIWEPSRAWSFLVSYAHTNAEVTKDTAIPDGDKLPRVPDDSGRIAVRYRFLEGRLAGLGAGLGMTAASSAEITLPNVDRSDSYVTFDAQLSYETGPYRFGLSAVNLFDEDYFMPYQYLAQSVVRPGNPRSVFATIGVQF